MKKWIILLLCLILVSLAAVSLAEETPEMIAIHAQVPADWSFPCVWAWNEAGENAFASWPGEALTAGEDGWYSITVPGWINSVIVNANAGTVQTADLRVEAEKDLFLKRNPHVKEHFDSLDPVMAGNVYVEQHFPNAIDEYVPYSNEILRQFFPKTVSVNLENVKEIPKDVENTYYEELTNFADKILNLQKSDDYETTLNISRVKYVFGLNKRNINTPEDINKFITTLNERVMPALVVSQKRDPLFSRQKDDVITSLALNKLVCKKETPAELKYLVSTASSTYHKQAENKKLI